MNRKIFNLAIIVLAAFFIVGCKTSMSYTYKVETGDQIKVELDTSDGYSLKSEIPFTISKKDQIITQGIFLTLDSYDQYLSTIANDESATVIDEGNKNNVEYLFYQVDNSEYNYVMKIKDSNTGVLLGNNTSKESAEDVFNHLKFSKEK